MMQSTFNNHWKQTGCCGWFIFEKRTKHPMSSRYTDEYECNKCGHKIKIVPFSLPLTMASGVTEDD